MHICIVIVIYNNKHLILLYMYEGDKYIYASEHTHTVYVNWPYASKATNVSEGTVVRF